MSGGDIASPSASGNVTPASHPSALRRTLSSSSNEGPTSSKEKRRLRFTPLIGSSSGGLGLSGTEDFVYPGGPSDMEEGRITKGSVPKDQADYLVSIPGTPNISET